MFLNCYIQYVDDTFSSFKSQDVVIKSFSIKHTQFSIKNLDEGENMLPFLEVLIERSSYCFISRKFRQPIFIGLCFELGFFYPKIRKINQIKTLHSTRASAFF